MEDQNYNQSTQSDSLKIWLTILTVAVVVFGYLALAGAGGWWPFSPETEKSVNETESDIQNRGSNDELIKSYRNNEFGFEFMYPGFFVESSSLYEEQIFAVDSQISTDRLSVTIIERPLDGFEIFDPPGALGCIYDARINGWRPQSPGLDCPGPGDEYRWVYQHFRRSDLNVWIYSGGDGPGAYSVALVESPQKDFIVEILTTYSFFHEGFDDPSFVHLTGDSLSPWILQSFKFTN